MKRALPVLLVALLLASCATHDLRAPCRRPAFASLSNDCGPLKPFP